MQDSLDVYNTAVIGYSSADYVRVLDARLRTDDVRRVTVFWCLNDIYSDIRLAEAPTGTRLPGGALLRLLRKHYYTFQWAKALLFDRSRDFYTFDRRFYTYPNAHLTRSLADLEDIRRMLARRGIPYEVVLLPYEYGLRTADLLPQRNLTRHLRALGTPVVDVAPALPTGEKARTLYLYGDGIHLSAEGHRRVAEFLATALP